MLIEHHALSAAEHDELYSYFKRVSDNLRVTPEGMGNPHKPNAIRDAALGKAFDNHLPKSITSALEQLRMGKGPPVIILHHMPVDAEGDLPPTPKDKEDLGFLDHKGWISEYSLRALCAKMGLEDYRNGNQILRTTIGLGLESDIAQGGIGTVYHHEGGKNSKLIHFDTLLCLRDKKDVITYFAPSEKAVGVCAEDQSVAGEEGVELKRGDIAVFDNRRVKHKVKRFPLGSDPDQGRWLESLLMITPAHKSQHPDHILLTLNQVMAAENMNDILRANIERMLASTKSR